MGELIFILGGARSGKSAKAQELAASAAQDGPVLFISTIQPLDDKTKRRIAEQRLSRPEHWSTADAALDPAPVLRNVYGRFGASVIDSATSLVRNIMFQKGRSGLESDAEKKVMTVVSNLILEIKRFPAPVYVVSNDVGLGTEPESAALCNFRDIVGRANQTMAASADIVFFMTAGLMIQMKGK